MLTINVSLFCQEPEAWVGRFDGHPEKFTHEANKQGTQGEELPYTRSHALNFFFFFAPFPRSFRLKPCKYCVKTPWNTAFLLYNPSFMFTLVSMINQISLSIMIIDCLYVSSQMNNRLTNDFYIYLFLKRQVQI